MPQYTNRLGVSKDHKSDGGTYRQPSRHLQLTTYYANTSCTRLRSINSERPESPSKYCIAFDRELFLL